MRTFEEWENIANEQYKARLSVALVTMPIITDWALERSQRQWVKCSDRMPEKSGWYIIADPVLFQGRNCCHYDSESCRWMNNGFEYNPTHWMELPSRPQPPEVDNNKEVSK